MKTLLKGLLLGSLAVVAGLLIASDLSDAQTRPFTESEVTTIKTPPHGYSTVVESVWINDSDPLGTACYSTFDAPTGYWFHLIQVYSQGATAAQDVTVRLWASATDSTTIMASVDSVFAAADAAELEQEYPVRCYKASFNHIADTEDWKVIGYCKPY